MHEIHHAAASHDLPGLADLLEAVRGDLLDDFLDVSPGFDEWLLAERPRQRDLLLGAALDAVEADGLADMKDTRSILRSLDRIDPVNEAVARLGMRMDHASGDGASLHRRYRQLCERLDGEFAALPSEDTRALFHALVSSRPREPAAAPAACPHRRRRPRPAWPGGGDMIPLVLVAPLQTNGDGSLASLAAFCADDMRTAISRLRGVQVLAVDGGTIDTVVQQGEDALGLYLLSGSIRQVGADYRATLQLANAHNRLIVWSDSLRFGEAGEDMLDTLVAKAAGATLPAIDRDLDARLRQSADEIDSERAMYTRARLLIRTAGHLEAVQDGVRLLEALVARDPQHLGARLLLGRMYNTDFWQQVCGHDVQRFRELVRRPLARSRGDRAGPLRSARPAGLVAAAERRDRGGAPGFSTGRSPACRTMPTWSTCAPSACSHLGALEDAERLMQQAFFLNPLPPSDYHADYAVILALKGDHQAAEEHFAVSGEDGMQYAAGADGQRGRTERRGGRSGASGGAVRCRLPPGVAAGPAAAAVRRARVGRLYAADLARRTPRVDQVRLAANAGADLVSWVR